MRLEKLVSRIKELEAERDARIIALAMERGVFEKLKTDLMAERDTLLATLATERDAFSKRETELMAEVERLKLEVRDVTIQWNGAKEQKDLEIECRDKIVAERDALSQEVKWLRMALEYIEMSGGAVGHHEVCGVCPCGACMANEAVKALTITKDAGGA